MSSNASRAEQLNVTPTILCMSCSADMHIEVVIPVLYAVGLYEVVHRCSGCGRRIRRPIETRRDSKTAWQPIATVPTDRPIEVATLEHCGYHAFAYLVRRTATGWVLSEDDLRGPVPIDPTHWRDCQE